MAARARVTSVEAIDAFRASLILYLEKARPVLEEVTAELRRTLLWIETDRRLYWEREVRRRSRAVEEANQNLFSARLSSFRETTAVQQSAVHEARRSLAEAEEKLRRLRQWMREFGPRTETLARQINGLDHVLTQDGARAVAWLTETIRRLEAYAETPTPGTPSPASSPATGEATVTQEPASPAPPSTADAMPPRPDTSSEEVK